MRFVILYLKVGRLHIHVHVLYSRIVSHLHKIPLLGMTSPRNHPMHIISHSWAQGNLRELFGSNSFLILKLNP